jgi:hypothetical protein
MITMPMTILPMMPMMTTTMILTLMFDWEERGLIPALEW